MAEIKESFLPPSIQKISEFKSASGQPLSVFLTTEAKDLSATDITYLADGIEKVSANLSNSSTTQMRLRNGNFEVCYVTDADKQIIGYATLARRPENGCYIERVKIEKKHQNQDIAAGMVKALQGQFDHVDLILSPQAGQSNSYLFRLLNKLNFNTNNGMSYWWQKP